MQSDLSYLTHEVDGTTYGAWYRVLNGTMVEVLAVGLVRTAMLGDSGPEAIARGSIGFCADKNSMWSAASMQRASAEVGY